MGESSRPWEAKGWDQRPRRRRRPAKPRGGQQIEFAARGRRVMISGQLDHKMNPVRAEHKWDKRTSAAEQFFKHTGVVFESLFERCPDAIWLYDPQTIQLVDCNQAAVELMGAESKQQLLRTRPEAISPPLQPDGPWSSEKAREIIAIVEREKRHRFEWLIRRLDGRDVPVEVSSTALPMNGKSIHLVISRDISERKKAEARARAERELQTQILERRVVERTAALGTSEARFRALVE